MPLRKSNLLKKDTRMPSLKFSVALGFFSRKQADPLQKLAVRSISKMGDSTREVAVANDVIMAVSRRVIA